MDQLSSVTDPRVVYFAFAAVAIGAAVRLVKTATDIPPRWRPWLALGLGQLAGVVHAVATGATWQGAILSAAMGALSAIGAIGGHELLIEGVRGGRELGDGGDEK